MGFVRRRFLRQAYDSVIMTVCAAHVQPQKIMREINLTLPIRRPRSCKVCFLFGFVCLARHGKVNDVEPREDTREDRVQNRTIPMPRTYNSDRRTESYPCLGNRLRCLIGNLSNDHSVLTER